MKKTLILSAALMSMGFTSRADMQSSASETRGYIPPMLTTHWGEEAPYNSLCPAVDGKNCQAGSLTVATAQVMKYFGYPAQGAGSIIYTPNNNELAPEDSFSGPLSLDFSSVTFDWDSMTDNYNTSSTDMSITAVATLMQAVGYAIQVDYGVTQTTFNQMFSHFLPGMTQNLGYSEEAMLLERKYFSTEQWEQMIYDQLKEVGPVVYIGTDYVLGQKACVIDGYYNGQFHVNWGMGGEYDGYFSLHELIPAGADTGSSSGGHYCGNQMAVFNLVPAGRPTIDIAYPQFVMSTDLKAEIQTNNDTNELFVSSGNSICTNYSNKPRRLSVRLKFLRDDDKSDVEYYSSSAILMSDPCNPYSGLPSATFNFPSDIPKEAYGRFRVYVTAKDMDDPDSEIVEVAAPVGYNNYYYVDYHGDNINFTVAPTNSRCFLMNLSFESDLYQFTNFRYSFDTVNYSKETSQLCVVPVFFYYGYSGEEVCAIGDTKFLLSEPNTIQRHSMLSSMHKVDGADFPADKSIYFALYDLIEDTYTLMKEITILPRPADPSLNLKEFMFISGDTEQADAADIYFYVDVECNAGYYPHPLYVRIFPENAMQGAPSREAAAYDNALCQFNSTAMMLSEGNRDYAYIGGKFRQAETGASYLAIPYMKEETGLTPLTDTPIRFTITHVLSGVENVADDNTAPVVSLDRATGIASVEAQSAISSIEVYSLDGRLVATGNGFQGNNATVSLADSPAGIVIMRITLANSTVHTHKILR